MNNKANNKSTFDNIKKFFLDKKKIPFYLVLLFIIATVVFLTLRKSVDEYVVENHHLYRYFAGFRIDYNDVLIKLDKDKEITTISLGDKVDSITSSPLYYVGEERVLFPKSMAVINPRLGTQHRVNYYSHVFKDINMYSVKDREKKYPLSNSFLYDGNDIYFFIENVTVKFGDNSIQLGPLSFISVSTLDNYVDIYDYQNDVATVYEGVLDHVIVENEYYKINASLDLMYYGDKTKLFIKDIDVLKHL